MAACNIEVKMRRNESSESLIRRFNRKVKDSGVIREVFDRKYYEQPSVKRRKAKAARLKEIGRAHV